MNIVFFAHRYWPSVGGVEKYLHQLGRALLDRGHHVTVVAGAHSPGLAAVDNLEGVAIRRYPAYRSPTRACGCLLRMRSVFAGSDVIHVSDTFMLEYFCRMVAWAIPRRPLFLTRHGMSYIWPVPAWEKARARRAQRLVDGIVHDGCFIANWLEVEADCVPDQGLYPEADDLPSTPEPPPDSATFVGRLEPDSGIQIYLDAVRLLRDEKGLPIWLDVYGDGSLKGALQHQAERDQLPVRFHGWQADAQERVADGCFAFVAGRMAMQEAMARRRLVVAAYADPLKRDYVTGEPFSPYLLAGGDAGTIAELVARYAQQHADRRCLVEQGYAHARTLSWRRTAEEYLQLWRAAPRRQGTASLRERAALAWRLAAESRLPKWAVEA